jgi:hypothetical protein
VFSIVQFVYWEKGRDVFDRLLIDADWAINNGNWLWLSASAFFHQVKITVFSCQGLLDSKVNFDEVQMFRGSSCYGKVL